MANPLFTEKLTAGHPCLIEGIEAKLSNLKDIVDNVLANLVVFAGPILKQFQAALGTNLDVLAILVVLVTL